MTVDQIVEEARRWTPEKVGELVGRLTEGLHASESELAAASKTEIGRRLAEIQAGKVRGISGTEVSAHVRRIVGR